MSMLDSTVTPIYNALSAPQAHTDPTSPRWVLLHPLPTSPSTLTLLATGNESSIPDVRSALQQAHTTHEIIYGYMLVPVSFPSAAHSRTSSPGRGHTAHGAAHAQQRPKGVVLVYIAQTLGGVRRAKAVVGGRGVASLFPDYSALIHFGKPEELTDELVLEKLGLDGYAAIAASHSQSQLSASQVAVDGAHSTPAPHAAEGGNVLLGPVLGQERGSEEPAHHDDPAPHHEPDPDPLPAVSHDHDNVHADPPASQTVASPTVPAPVITAVVHTPEPAESAPVSISRHATPIPPVLEDPVPEPASASSVYSPQSSDPFPHPNAQTYDPILPTPLPQTLPGTSHAFPTSSQPEQTAPSLQTEQSLDPQHTTHEQHQPHQPIAHKGVYSTDYFPSPADNNRTRKVSLGQKLGGVFSRSSSSSTNPSPAQTADTALVPPSSPASPKESSGRFKPSSLIRSFGKKRGSVSNGSMSNTPPGSPDPGASEFGALPPPVPPKGGAGDTGRERVFSRAPYHAAHDEGPELDVQHAADEYAPAGENSVHVIRYDGPIESSANGTAGTSSALSPPQSHGKDERGLSPSPSAKAALAQVAQKRVVEEEEMMARYRDAERQRTISASSKDGHEINGVTEAHHDKDGDEDSIRLAYDEPESPEKAVSQTLNADGRATGKLRPTMPGGMESFSTPAPTPGLEAASAQDHGGLGVPHGLQGDIQTEDKGMMQLESDAERGDGLQSNNLASDHVASGPVSDLRTIPEEGLADQRAIDAENEWRLATAAAAQEKRIAFEEDARRAAEHAEAQRAEQAAAATAMEAEAERVRLAQEAQQKAEMETQLEKETEARARAEQEERARQDAIEREEERRLEEARVAEEARSARELKEREEAERLRVEEEQRKAEAKARIRREEAERVQREEEEKRQAEEEKRRVEEEERRRVEEEKNRVDEEKRRAEEERLKREQEEQRRALEETLRLEEEERVRKAKVREGLEKGKTEGGVMLSGWITTQNARSPIWRRRWFKLSNGQLLLFKSQDDSKPISTVRIPSSTTVAETFEESQVKGSFKVSSGEEGQGDEWFMYADSEEERETVLMGLEMAKA